MGGAHALNNLVLLCGRHHARVHHHNEMVVLRPDGVVEIRSGLRSRWSHPPPDLNDLLPDGLPSDDARCARERDAVRAALARVRSAVRWTDADHRHADTARRRCAALVSEDPSNRADPVC